MNNENIFKHWNKWELLSSYYKNISKAADILSDVHAEDYFLNQKRAVNILKDLEGIKEEIKQGNKLCLIEEIRTWINANENNDNCDEELLSGNEYKCNEWKKQVDKDNNTVKIVCSDLVSRDTSLDEAQDAVEYTSSYITEYSTKIFYI